VEGRPTENIEAYLAFAEAERFRYSGNYFELEKALPLYEKAMALDPDFIGAQVGYAEANFTIWSRSYNTIRFTPDALVVAEGTIARILAADPSNPYAIGLQARLKIEWLNHGQALSEARAAVFLQPDQPWLRNVLGLALLASGKYEEAREEFASYESLSTRLNSGEKRELALQYLLLGDAKKALSLLASVPTEEADRITQYFNLAGTYARLGDIEIARINLQKVLQNVPWLSLSFYKTRFAIYSDRTIFEQWAAAMTAAGFPASPYDFEAGREDDRLLHADLVDLFSDRYREVHTVGPFGMPYKEDRRADGILIMDFAWMNGKLFIGNWYIKEDQFCHRIPAQQMGREECNNVYIDREKSTDSIKYISNVYSWGIFNSEFWQVEE
jgi:adenylate cyclase